METTKRCLVFYLLALNEIFGKPLSIIRNCEMLAKMPDELTSYDRIPYRSYPYRQTHPDRMATIARLLKNQESYELLGVRKIRDRKQRGVVKPGASTS